MPLTQSHSRRSAAARSPVTSRPHARNEPCSAITRIGHSRCASGGAHRLGAGTCLKAGMQATGCGIGLRAPHVAEITATAPPIPWLEIHAENYMSGGPAPRALERLRRDYPISVHGVGLSLGSAAGLDEAHLTRLVRLVEWLEPALVSEHLSWSVHDGTYSNHLLPLPYTEHTLALLARHVARAQDRLGHR